VLDTSVHFTQRTQCTESGLIGRKRTRVHTVHSAQDQVLIKLRVNTCTHRTPDQVWVEASSTLHDLCRDGLPPERGGGGGDIALLEAG